MAKCPKCLKRKGKRYCPALDEAICSPCCAQHRLKTIACPQDCPHLQAEYYQLSRRQTRAKSMGKGFLASLAEHFLKDESREFAFKFQADVYWWMRENRPLSNSATLEALEEVKNSISTIVVAARSAAPLARFLVEILASKRHELTSQSFQREHQMRAIEVLLKHIRSLGDDDGLGYHEEIAAYFDQLDFEADLDYSPRDELSEEKPSGSEAFKERSSGLIVPKER